ncbi:MULTISPECIES: DUF1572 family protein [Lysinibacillus]|jgi:hypothetical protein|uniref:DUF1572 family protein n=1 Tax=Lysinibacillus TaxID=400634 RepID=UPI0004D48F2C|nr:MULTISPECIES: DUF1572 family protein [Lysinibacillus]MDC6266247.1 DUF1572 family protein [Lysinibacillus sphaericus]AJK88328.1 hypothetical protein HR49_14900 [Lysinibacillus fusiformis]KGA84240.1 hypothetical protein KQ41_05490 [Lysinibacillus fusiformis]KHK49951.1 hypothetical protein PI85_18870 [Lysinibacillus sp. A1]MDN4970121.1 DUF1572 family protein [Lysinibacillus fusiformis]
MTIAQTYLQVIQKRFNNVKELGDGALAQLEGAELHWAYNEESNSVAVIVKHVSGNMISRWTDFLTTDGEKTTRNRDDEFINSLSTKEAILAVWEEGWQVFLDALAGITESDLQGYVTIRGEKLAVIDAIERQMAHYSQHIGQMIYIAKQVKGSEWQTLSIARGQSQAFNKAMLENSHEK